MEMQGYLDSLRTEDHFGEFEPKAILLRLVELFPEDDIRELRRMFIHSVGLEWYSVEQFAGIVADLRKMLAEETRVRVARQQQLMEENYRAWREAGAPC